MAKAGRACSRHSQFVAFPVIGLRLVVIPLAFLSLGGYLINPKTGALIYNIVHHKALSILLYSAGSLAQIPSLQLAGVVMLAHSSFDRALGFELQQSTVKGT